mmetsp:Transcript_63032/g.119203  ORF Transcript_63032/g.119203 Transcript_63032/m.119203 type:complete len:238 (-) Transcript_63032:20-733(-)
MLEPLHHRLQVPTDDQRPVRPHQHARPADCRRHTPGAESLACLRPRPLPQCSHSSHLHHVLPLWKQARQCQGNDIHILFCFGLQIVSLHPGTVRTKSSKAATHVISRPILDDVTILSSRPIRNWSTTLQQQPVAIRFPQCGPHGLHLWGNRQRPQRASWALGTEPDALRGADRSRSHLHRVADIRLQLSKYHPGRAGSLLAIFRTSLGLPDARPIRSVARIWWLGHRKLQDLVVMGS